MNQNPATRVTEGNNNTLKKNQHGLITEVPHIIYSLVQDALKLRNRLERNKNDKALKSALKFAEDKIASFTEFYHDINILPPGWKYDPATASNLVIKSFRGSESKNWKKRSGKKLVFEKYNIEQPQINDVSLDDMGLKSLQEFIDIDKDTPALPAGCIPLEDDDRVLEVDVGIAVAVSDYAVNAFNKAIQTYDKDKRILTEAVLKKCSYRKMCNNEYWFTSTLEAVEEGVIGVYKTKVSCTMNGGKMKLLNFIRPCPPKGKRDKVVPRPISTNKHKTLKGSFDPAGYYNHTGFVERMYAFGGYDYQNPREVLFRSFNCTA